MPEQVWDAADIPARELFLGKPTGSACPLVWAHSEYIKLVRSLKDGKIFDQPPQTVKRYRVEQRKAVFWEWRFNNKCRTMPQGQTLRIAVMAKAQVRWSDDGWQTSHDAATRDTGLGVCVADIPTSSLETDRKVVFTFFWPQARRWEGTDFSLNRKRQLSFWQLNVPPLRPAIPHRSDDQRLAPFLELWPKVTERSEL